MGRSLGLLIIIFFFVEPSGSYLLLKRKKSPQLFVFYVACIELPKDATDGAHTPINRKVVQGWRRDFKRFTMPCLILKKMNTSITIKIEMTYKYLMGRWP